MPRSPKHETAGMAVLMLDKNKCQERILPRINGDISEGKRIDSLNNITMLHVHRPDNPTSKYMKQN